MIYHLIPTSDYARLKDTAEYRPESLSEEGFIHCTGDLDTLVAVANDYFGSLEEPLLVLQIAVEQVEAPVVWEAPATGPAAGREHLGRARTFPHIYGPLNLSAVTGVAEMAKVEGRYERPVFFLP
ncbi:MAG: DUF952 domain-containing protein [Dehalococcoidia bacterium]